MCFVIRNHGSSTKTKSRRQSKGRCALERMQQWEQNGQNIEGWKKNCPRALREAQGDRLSEGQDRQREEEITTSREDRVIIS